MKKRLIPLLLALTLLIPLLPMTAGAAGSLEGVDYTRIHENETLKKAVTFHVGDHEFEGWLTNGETLTDEEVDKIIRGVMTREKITSGMLIGAHSRAANALKVNDNAIPYTALLEFMLAMKGVPSAEDVSKILTGEKPIPTDSNFYETMLMDLALNELFSFVLGKIGGEALDQAVSLVQNSATIGLREYYAYIDREEEYEKKLAAAIALERFYALCNADIRKAEEEKGVNQWRITCAQTQWENITLFGSIPVTQWWRLECDLERTAAGEGWGGQYQGMMKLDIWHDMSNFDAQFKDKIYNSSGLPFGMFEKSGMFSVTDKYTQPSSLTKTLTNPKFTIVLDAGLSEKGELRKPFSFSGFNDRSSFWAYHPIRTAAEHSLWNDGHLHVSVPYATVSSTIVLTHTFVGEMSDNNMGVKIDYYGWDNDLVNSVTGPQSYQYDNSSSGTGHGTLMTDNKVYTDLRIQPQIVITN